MKGILRLCGRGLFYFAISSCAGFTGLLLAWDAPVSGFSQVHFDGTFVMLGQHVLDTSDLGVLLAEANPHFQDLSKSDRKDLSWDSDGVRFTADSQTLKVTWVVDPTFLHEMSGHPTHVFNGKLSILEIDIVRNKPVQEGLLSKCGFEAAADQVPRNYLLKKNGWKINIITDRDRAPEAVTLEHSLTPE
jgi:hypothetical protein